MSDGITTYDPALINNAFQSYYESLYCSQNSALELEFETFLNNISQLFQMKTEIKRCSFLSILLAIA